MSHRRLLFLVVPILWIFPILGFCAVQENPKTIGISQIVEHPALDKVRIGVISALARQGFVEGKNLTIHRANAQGNMVTSTQIATQLLSMPLDAIVAISTPSAQTLLFTAERSHKRVPIVFAAVSDPESAKLEPGKSSYPITGITDTPNLEGMLEVISKMLPNIKTLGVLYNPAEANSVSTVMRLKELLQSRGIFLQEVGVNSTGNIAQAMQSVIGKSDALYFPQDNTVVSAIETVVSMGKGAKLPIFCNDPLLVERGVLAAIGYDYEEIGREAGGLVAKLLKGGDIKQMPIHSPVRLQAVINKPLAQQLGLKVPKNLAVSKISISEISPPQ